MKRNKKKEQVYNSMIEFEKKFLPNPSKKQLPETDADARSLGISLAKESLDKVRRRLLKE